MKARHHRRSRLKQLVALGCGMSLFGACASDSNNDAELDPEPVLHLERTTVVDGANVEFGEIGAVVAGEDGTIYVADVQAQEIVVVSPEGTQSGVIGRQGEGPGEFRGLRPTLAWIEGLLYAFDWRNQTITLFDESGSVANTISWPNGRFSKSALLVGGRRLYAREVIFAPIQEPSAPRPVPRLQFVSFDGTRPPAVIPMPADSVIWPYSIDCEAPSGAIHILPIPLRTWFPREAALPMGLIAVAHRDSLVVQIFDASTGQPIRRIGRDLPRVEVTDATWESLPEVAEFRAIQEDANGDLWLPGNPGEACELPRPELFPAVRAVVSDDAGRLWVETVTPSGFNLIVFDPDGTFIGHVAMPPRDPSIPFYVRGNRLYLVSSDELDLQSVEIYEVYGLS